MTAKGTLWAIGGGEGGIGGKRGNDEGMTASTTHDGYPGSRGAATVSDLGGVNTVKVGNDRENCEFAGCYRSEKYCEYFYCDHTWESFSGMTHQCSSCGMTGSHADEDGDRICDLCKVNIRVTVRYHTENGAACAFEVVCSAGDVLWDRIGDLVLALQKNITGQLYADGSLMETGDLILTEEEYLDLYAVFGYPGAAPTCTSAGHKAYYYSSLSCTYCADVACKQTVGDGEALKAWLSLTGAGYIAPLGHTDADFDGKCDVCEDLFCGHENVEVYYEWDIIHHTYCDAVLHCPDCGITHTERSAKVDLIEEIAGKDCLTKGTKTYRATFPTVESAETTEYTALGDHVDGDRNGWCDICGVFAVKAYETVTESTSVLAEGSWIVNKSVQFDTALTVSGTVTLYLADDTVLTAACGILLTDGNSLTVCAQSDGDRMGVIRAGGSLKGAAGIGGDFFDSDAGALTVNGGHIIAAGGMGAAGIGGGFGGKDGTFTKNGGNVEVINGEGYVSSHEHTFADKYTFNENYHWHIATCEHTDLVSGFGAHTFGDGVADGNKTVYTCSVCGYRKYVYNTAGGNEGEIIGSATYTGISLTLDSDIYINFYMQLTDEALKNGKMVFTIGKRTVEGVTAKLNESNGRYYFACPLNVLEMAETVTATFTFGSTTYTQEYSVKQYVQAILGGDYAPAMQELARKIANYGYYAQLYLESIHNNVTIGDDGYAEMLSNFASQLNITEALTLEDKFTATANTANLTFDGRTVYFDSATALNFYVITKDGNAPTATCDKGKTVEIKKYSGNTYIVSVKDITATELADTYTVTVSHGGDTMTLKGSVLDYCAGVMNAHRNKTADKDVKAVNAMAAFYEYYKAACDYANRKIFKDGYLYFTCDAPDMKKVRLNLQGVDGEKELTYVGDGIFSDDGYVFDEIGYADGHVAFTVTGDASQTVTPYLEFSFDKSDCAPMIIKINGLTDGNVTCEIKKLK